MYFNYNSENPILKFELVAEDVSKVQPSQQYSNLVKSIKDILGDESIDELDKKELLIVLRNKTKQPINSLDELKQLLDEWQDYGNKLEQVDNKLQNYVETKGSQEVSMYSTSDDDALEDRNQPVAESFDLEVTDEE